MRRNRRTVNRLRARRRRSNRRPYTIGGIRF